MKLKPFLFFIFYCFTSLFYAQENLPQNYFGNPLEIETILAGTFAELRSNHFHSGVDIKTQQKEGLKVLATANGYVSRIKIAHYGYGKALYITHPNGYTTVYGHLQKFAPEIEAYIKENQYAKESFEIELFPTVTQLQVTKGQQVAVSGNTGGSGGPHLHYEIRDAQERPMNPMLFGLEVKDTRKPTVKGVFAYALNDTSQVSGHNNRLKIKLTPTKSGNYVSQTIYALGNIGFGVNTSDLQDLAYNKNGVFNIQTTINGIINYELDFKKFAFSESRHLNHLIDYSYFKEYKARIQKLFNNTNNPLSIIKNVENNGEIYVLEGEKVNYKIIITDYKNNSRTITIPIIGKKQKITHFKDIEKTPYYVQAKKGFNFDDEDKSVYIPKNALYQDAYIKYETHGDTITIGNKQIPLHKSMYIHFKTDKYKNQDVSKLFVASLGYNNKPYYTYCYKKDGKLTAKTRSFGRYTVATDNTAPKIKPINVFNGKWFSKNKTLQMKVSDDLSGVKKYRATINGKWILMEYDYKKGKLTYNFSDNIIKTSENKFKLIVIDNVGNNSIFEMTFFRKI